MPDHRRALCPVRRGVIGGTGHKGLMPGVTGRQKRHNPCNPVPIPVFQIAHNLNTVALMMKFSSTWALGQMLHLRPHVERDPAHRYRSRAMRGGGGAVDRGRIAIVRAPPAVRVHAGRLRAGWPACKEIGLPRTSYTT